MFNPHYRDNSNSSGAAYMEIMQQRTDGTRSRDSLEPVFMPLLRSHLSGRVAGPVARLTLEHRFGHREEEDSPVLEAVYRFPLPGDAAVTGVQVTFGETEIRAELADRAEAEREYDDARSTGRQAVLVTRESPDVFSLHVSGIQSGQNVTVRTEFVQLCRSNGARFQLRVPLTPAPRFSGREDVFGRHSEGQPLAVAHDPGHRFSMELSLDGAESVESRTHKLSLERDESVVRLTLEQGDVIPDRDLEVSWGQPRHEHQASLRAMHCLDTSSGGDPIEYFISMISPPLSRPEQREQPREVILLVDRSGSMRGAKWQAADWTVQRFLSGLKPYDSFSVGLFHDSTRWFATECLSATDDNVASARRFIERNHESGGTRLELALREAIECGRARGKRSRHIVVITDAQVSNAAGILDLLRDEAKREDRRRVSVLCIDAAPNSHLVHEMVAIGGGRASFLTSDPDEGDVTTALDELLSFWDEPVETGLSLVVNRPDAWVMGRPVSDQEGSEKGASRIDIGDLPASQPIWVAGRTSASDSPLSFSLENSDGEILATAESAVIQDQAPKTLFGARRLMALEYQLESMSTRSSRRRMNVRSSDGSRQNLRELLVAESLHYGLACSETSFIAVRQEAGKVVQRGAIVPNALPYGWSDEFVSYSALPAMANLPDNVLFSMARSEDAEYAVEQMSYQAYERPRSRRLGSERHVVQLFSGVPPVSSEAVTLYDSERFGQRGRLVGIRITIDGDDPGTFDGVLELYLGTVHEPRARVRLRDVIRQGGFRPLNVRVSGMHSLRLVLRDVTGGDQPPPMTIEVELA